MNLTLVSGKKHKADCPQYTVAYLGNKQGSDIFDEVSRFFITREYATCDEIISCLENQKEPYLPHIILIEKDIEEGCLAFIEAIKENHLLSDPVLVIVTSAKNKEFKARALQLKVHDFYVSPFPTEHLIERLNFLVEFKFFKANYLLSESSKELEEKYIFQTG